MTKNDGTKLQAGWFMALPDRVRSILEEIGQVAVELPSPIEDCQEFVSVYLFRPNWDSGGRYRLHYFKGAETLYRVCRFRVRRELIENDVQVGPDDLWDLQSLIVSEEALLEQILALWLSDLAVLGRPADCSIPI